MQHSRMPRIAPALVVSLAACSNNSALPQLGETNHQIFEHVVAEARENVATGSFAQPAVSWPAIPVDARFKHQLTFQMTPMSPPTREKIATTGPIILFSD